MREARAYGKCRARTQRTAAVSEPKRCPGLEPLDDTDQFFDMGCLEPGERGEKRADPVAEPGARAARPGLLNPEPEKAPPGRRVEPGVGDHAQPSLDGRQQARRRETRIDQVVAARADVSELQSLMRISYAVFCW